MIWDAQDGRAGADNARVESDNGRVESGNAQRSVRDGRPCICGRSSPTEMKVIWTPVSPCSPYDSYLCSRCSSFTPVIERTPPPWSKEHWKEHWGILRSPAGTVGDTPPPRPIDPRRLHSRAMTTTPDRTIPCRVQHDAVNVLVFSMHASHVIQPETS